MKRFKKSFPTFLTTAWSTRELRGVVSSFCGNSTGSPYKLQEDEEKKYSFNRTIFR